MKALIFDLDGVIVDTARYHYLAWKKLGEDLGFEFSAAYNERQKGVSRMASLEVLLEAGGIQDMDYDQKAELAERKNKYYLQMIEEISAAEILPGIPQFLQLVKQKNYKIALGSASKSGGMIIDKVGLSPYFDVIIDGNLVTIPKPDPQVFCKGSEMLGAEPAECIVIEDARAGVEAAKSGGMKCIGIGRMETLDAADVVVQSTKYLRYINLESI